MSGPMANLPVLQVMSPSTSTLGTAGAPTALGPLGTAALGDQQHSTQLATQTPIPMQSDDTPEKIKFRQKYYIFF
mgnify:CR=1 FL=1